MIDRVAGLTRCRRPAVPVLGSRRRRAAPRACSSPEDLALVRAGSRRHSGELHGCEDGPSGPDRVPGEGALRQAWRAGAAGHGRRDGGRGAGGSRARSVVQSSSRRRSRPAAVARPAASSSPRRPPRPPRRPRPSSAWTSRATPSTGCSSTQASDIAEEYYFSFLLDRANRTYLAMASVEGGMEIEQLAVERPEALAKVAGRRAARASTLPRPAEIVRRRGLRRRRTRSGRRHPAEAVGRLHRRGRHPRRGQPAGQDAGRGGRRPRRQGHPRRQRRLPAPRPRRVRGQGCGRPARGGGQGEGPQLRQARRRGRHHRQRRRSRHVDARRRGLRR